jgi:hypothetical protein
MPMGGTTERSHHRTMFFDEVALAVMQRAWPHYAIKFGPDDGVWVARYSSDRRAPIIAAASPEALTALLGDDASRRRGGVDSGSTEQDPEAGQRSRSARVLPGFRAPWASR